MTILRPGMRHGFSNAGRAAETAQRVLDAGVPADLCHVEGRVIYVDVAVVLRESEEDVAIENARHILEWCHKNGTCKRQRAHGVRLDKKAASGRARAVAKRALHRQIALDEDHGRFPVPRWRLR